MVMLFPTLDFNERVFALRFVTGIKVSQERQRNVSIPVVSSTTFLIKFILAQFVHALGSCGTMEILLTK